MSKVAFEKLQSVEYSNHIEVKAGKFKYLSWAWAWKLIKQNFPEATFTKHENPQGYPCFFDHNGNAFVKVSVTIEGTTHTEYLSVMDNRMKSIQNPTADEVNKSLQRCLVKAIAYHGLGIELWINEDLPDDTAAPKISEPKKKSSPEQNTQPLSVEIHPVNSDADPTVIEADAKASIEQLIVATFEEFIPTCNTESEINSFFKSNRHAYNMLSEADQKKINIIFGDRKKAVTKGTIA